MLWEASAGCDPDLSPGWEVMWLHLRAPGGGIYHDPVRSDLLLFAQGRAPNGEGLALPRDNDI